MKNTSDSGANPSQVLIDIQKYLHSLHDEVSQLSTTVKNVENRLDAITESLKVPEKHQSYPNSGVLAAGPLSSDQILHSVGSSAAQDDVVNQKPSSSDPKPVVPSSKIILTTYPGQSGIDPVPLLWGDPDPHRRGPIVVSRAKATVRRRNAIGAHGGSYSIYYALAVASKNLNVDHRPDFTNTEPAVKIGPFPQWGDSKKIVSMDPFGHLSPWLYSDLIQRESLDIRPTIAVTRAHMIMPELENSVRSGRLTVDGKICLNERAELAVTKVRKLISRSCHLANGPFRLPLNQRGTCLGLLSVLESVS